MIYQANVLLLKGSMLTMTIDLAMKTLGWKHTTSRVVYVCFILHALVCCYAWSRASPYPYVSERQETSTQQKKRI